MSREGSLFSGYNGLGMAVSEVFGSEPAWFSEIEDGPSKILAHHWPDVPNLGDITKVDWDQVEPVDILSGGFPCQDVSAAGKRAGLHPDTRSGLWNHFAYAISKLRPRYVVAENVRGLLSAEAHSDVEPCPWCLGEGSGEPDLRALGAVLGDLADLGYDAQWCGLRAADVGAAHGRYRIFILARNTSSIGSRTFRADCGESLGADRARRAGELSAADSDDPRRIEHWRAGPARTELAAIECGGGSAADSDRDPLREQPVSQFGRSGEAILGLAGDLAAHTAGERHGNARTESLAWVSAPFVRGAATDSERERHEQALGSAAGEAEGDGPLNSPDGRGGMPVAADAARNGWHEGRSESAGELGGPDAAERGASTTAWGLYGPAIERWERVLGRVAPAPTEPNSKGSQRLNPAFVEWMMGLPAGHVTAVPGVNRNAQLKALGNGVVPQQAVAALRHMLASDCL